MAGTDDLFRGPVEIQLSAPIEWSFPQPFRASADCMAIEFDCPGCRTRIRTPDEAAGKKARCPQCGNISEIPPSSLPESTGSPFAAGVFPSASANPFSDQVAPSISSPLGASPNPYASPSWGGYQGLVPLSRDEVRMKLLGPAIGISIGAFFCLGYLAVVFLAMILQGDFGRNAPNDEAGRAGYFAGVVFACIAFCVPGLLMLFGAFAMFRGKGKLAAWTGAIASVLPCNPCFFIGIAFGIWGMVVLSDSRVARVLDSTN